MKNVIIVIHMLRKTMMTSHFNSMISTTLKKYLILLFSLVASIGVSAQEKEVEVGMKCIVETAIIDSVDCSNEYFIKDIYVDYCVYTDDITLSIYGDVPKVTGNITPTDSAIETEIDKKDGQNPAHHVPPCKIARGAGTGKKSRRGLIPTRQNAI